MYGEAAKLLSLPQKLRREDRPRSLACRFISFVIRMVKRRRFLARRRSGLQSRPDRARPHNTQTCGPEKVVSAVVVSAVVIIAIIIIVAIAWSSSCS